MFTHQGASKSALHEGFIKLAGFIEDGFIEVMFPF